MNSVHYNKRVRDLLTSTEKLLTGAGFEFSPLGTPVRRSTS